MSRLTLLHINIIGVVVGLIVAVALYFTLITNGQEDIKKNQTAFQGVQDRANQFDANKKSYENALAEEKKTTAEYAVYKGAYMQTLGQPKDRTVAMIRDWWPNRGRSIPERFINGVNKHMAGETRKYGLVWENKGVVALPAYGPDPNSIDMGDHGYLTFGPYQMVVRGKTFQSLLNHYQDWNSLHNLGVPVTDGLSITGNSPNLVATYTVTFTNIVDEPFPAIDPRIGGGGGGGGAGAGPGVGPGGPVSPGGGMGSGARGGGSGMGGGSGAMGGSGAAGSARRGGAVKE